MKIEEGKIPETIRKRSIIKQIHHQREEIYTGPGSTLDASILLPEDGEGIVFSTNPVIGSLQQIPDKVVHTAINNVLVKGARPVGIMINILLPLEEKEEELRSFMIAAEERCKELGIGIIGGHTEAAPAVNRPVISVTAVGTIKKNEVKKKVLLPSYELVMTKWAGQEGSVILAEEKAEQLEKRYTKEFLKDAKKSFEGISVWDTVQIIKEDAIVMHDITSSGIFGALWEIADAYQIGFEVDLRKIPIKQETIEICEFFDLNPYLLSSGGCLLLVTEHGNELQHKLGREGIEASVIGRITENKDKIVWYDEEARCIEPPNKTELLKVLKEEKYA